MTKLEKPDTSNLYPGLVAQNYPEMCSLLNVPTKGGDSKRSQLKEWERYFRYTKKGHKFIVDEIHKTPKPKVDNSVYVRLIECILAYELTEGEAEDKKSYAVNYTKTDLFQLLGLANDKYRKKNRELCEENLDVPKWQILDFYKHSENRLSEILRNALDSMKRRSLLDYRPVKIIVEDKASRKATEREEALLLKAGNETLLEMGLRKIPFWNYQNLLEYYGRLNNKLREDYGWDATFSAIRVVYTPEQISKNLEIIVDDMLDAFERQPIVRSKRLELNQVAIDSYVRQVENRYTAVEDKFQEEKLKLIAESIEEGWLDEGSSYLPSPKGIFKYPKDFVENQKFLAEFFLKIF